MKTQFIEKQRQISFVKATFSQQLEKHLGLIEVQAPLLSAPFPVETQQNGGALSCL